MHPQKFAYKNFGLDWNERTLQTWLQRKLGAQAEVTIRTPSGVRRADLVTANKIIECKDVGTYDKLLHAAGQVNLYQQYGPKSLGFIPKKRVIAALAPSSPEEAAKAKRLAKDLEGRGIAVWFVNERFDGPSLAPVDRFFMVTVASLVLVIGLVAFLGN